MEENYQLTITDYMNYKENLQRELNNVVNGFIKTGYYLKKIRDAEAYKNDGYNSIYEFAEREFGITRTVASRFMSINDKFSEDGYSLELKDQYKGLGSSRLSEMLSLPEEDHAMITNVTKIEDIRELKRFEKEQNKEESTMDELLKALFRESPTQLEAVMTKDNSKDVAEIVNPSGNKSFRYKMDFMMMHEYEKGIDIKNYQTGMHHMSWEEFIEECKKVFIYDPEAAGTVHKQNYPDEYKESISEDTQEEEKESENQSEEKQPEIKENQEKTVLGEAENAVLEKREEENDAALKENAGSGDLEKENYKDSVNEVEENKNIVREEEEDVKEEVQEEHETEVEDKHTEVQSEEKAEVVEGEVENGVCDFAQNTNEEYLKLYNAALAEAKKLQDVISDEEYIDAAQKAEFIAHLCGKLSKMEKVM